MHAPGDIPRLRSSCLGRGKRLALASACLTLLALAMASVAQGAGRIYWSNLGGNKISYADLDGSGGADLPIDPAVLNGPMGLAIDTIHGKLYWANYGINTGGGGPPGTSIGEANLDGSDAHLLPVGVPVVAPHGVAVDPSAGKVYWTNHDNSTGQSWIGVATPDGGGAAYFNTSGTSLNGPRGLALDKPGGRLYWANWDGNTISYANLDGSGGHDLALGSATVNQPEGVALSRTQNRLYYGNFTNTAPGPGDTISYANLDGSGGADLQAPGAPENEPHGVAIDPTTNLIYWPNWAGNSISYANLNGSGGALLPTPGATLNGPDLPILLKAPSLDKLTVTGKARPGAKLHCADNWADNDLAALFYRAPQSVSYKWLKGGGAIQGADQGTLKAPGIGNYVCRATAVNAAGNTAAVSDSQPVFKIGKPKRDPTDGTALLMIKVPGPGKVSLKGKGVVKDRLERLVRTARKIRHGKARLLVQAKGKAKRRLQRKGKSKVKVRVRYKEKGALAVTQTEHVRLILH